MTDVPHAPPAEPTARLDVIPFDHRPRDWDTFVADSEGSTFCHLSAWRSIMADVLGHDSTYLVAVGEDGTWRGILPLVRVRSRIFGHYLLSMPFLSYGGPLGSPEAKAKLASHAVSLARDMGADLLELRCRRLPPLDLRISERKVMVVLQLPTSADELWRDGFRAKLRSQIKRPLKEGMEARFGADQLEAFCGVYSRNMRDLGTPVLPRSWFERIAEDLAEVAVFGSVYWGDRPVAVGCGFAWQDEFEMSWASSLNEYNRYAPNMLLYWSFMQAMIERGIRVFNFGRCTPGGGTHRFKLQWGGVDVPLPWAQWSPGSREATPSPERPIYRLATNVWRRLPLSVANRLGPVVARYLP